MSDSLFCIPQRYDFSSKSQQVVSRVFPPICCFVYRKGTIFQANHNIFAIAIASCRVVLYTAKVRFFKQITTCSYSWCIPCMLFCIPQRYDFSSKSQLTSLSVWLTDSCFVYRKGTIFQANHNKIIDNIYTNGVVLYTAKVRFFKQITTHNSRDLLKLMLFCIPQRYDFSSKSQLNTAYIGNIDCCFVYRKGTIFQANHNCCCGGIALVNVVLYTAKVRFFKQITTNALKNINLGMLFCIPQRYDFSSKSQLIPLLCRCSVMLFCIPQRYDFSSKSQPSFLRTEFTRSCFVYRKGTIFQANHNGTRHRLSHRLVVLYTAKVRFFKQITTCEKMTHINDRLFCIPQRYDFSSKSQHLDRYVTEKSVVLYTAKVRFFKQITTCKGTWNYYVWLFCIPQRYDFSSKSQLSCVIYTLTSCCFVYRKGTIFQANHNIIQDFHFFLSVVLYTAKVRFFKQITTLQKRMESMICCFVYRKGTIFQANHNKSGTHGTCKEVVLYTAKVRFFKQITTPALCCFWPTALFCIPQRYDFSSKSQPGIAFVNSQLSCFVYRKGTIFQANHNILPYVITLIRVVLYTAKVRFFKQITT